MERNRKFLVLGLIAALLLVVISFSRWSLHKSYRSAHRLPRIEKDEGPTAQTEIGIYRKRLQKDPKNWTEWNVIGGLLFSEFKATKNSSYLKEAEAAARKSLALMPSLNPAGKNLLSQCLDQRHQFVEAIRLAKEVLKDKPGQSSALSLLVTAQIALGDYEEALEAAFHYSRVKPEPQSFAVLGLALSQRGRFEDASAAFETALQLERSSDDAKSAAWMRSIFARLLIRHGDIDHADALLSEALQIIPDHPLALSLKGEMFERRGNFQETARYYLNAFESSKETPYLISYARVLEKIGRAGEAKTLRLQAASIIRENLKNPQESTGHRLELAELLLTENNWKEALPLLEEELKVRHSHEIHFALSRAHYLKGDVAKSMEYWDKVLAVGVPEEKYLEFARTIDQKYQSHTGQYFNAVGSRLPRK